MKRLIIFAALVMIASAGLSAQATTAGAVNGMTLNGSTGLIVVPDAHIAWEQADIGVDIGYGIVWAGGQDIDHLPRFAISLFRKFEISGALHFSSDDPNNPLATGILGAKFQLYGKSGTALAIGGDFEIRNNALPGANSSKIYLAATYGGDFFNMPAVTSATIGWQLLNNGTVPSSQFVYGMGFSMGLFPSVFKDYVYWVTDFANFSYTVLSANVNSGNRGAFNTGIRIHPIKGGRFNLVIDVIGTDLLDTSRGLSANVSGGLAF